MRMHALAWAPIFAGACCNQGAALRARHLCLTPSEPTPQVNGKRYALFECIYLRPWPNAEPWIARIEEILSRIGKTNKVESVLCVRWFYQRHQLLPSGEGEFPPCSNADREVYRSTGKPDEVQLKTLIGSCSVAAASEVPNLKAFLADDDAFFYQYEYSPLAKEKREPLFRLLDGAEQPAANGGAVAEERAGRTTRCSGGGGGGGGSSAASCAPAAAATSAPAAASCAPVAASASAASKPSKRARNDKLASGACDDQPQYITHTTLAAGNRPGGCVMFSPGVEASSGSYPPKPLPKAARGRPPKAKASPRAAASGGDSPRAAAVRQAAVPATASTVPEAPASIGTDYAAGCGGAGSSSSSKGAGGGASDAGGGSGIIEAKAGGASASTEMGVTNGGASNNENGISSGEAQSGERSSDATRPSTVALAVSRAGGSSENAVLRANVVPLAPPAPTRAPTVLARLPGNGRSREERLVALQAKLDSMYPPFIDVNGVARAHEFEAVVPLPGERYAGEGCARCAVEGCDRFGRLFHLKNLMTHGAPRGGQASKIASARTHSLALAKLLGYEPPPPPLPKEADVRKRISKKAKKEMEGVGGAADEPGGAPLVAAPGDQQSGALAASAPRAAGSGGNWVSSSSSSGGGVARALSGGRQKDVSSNFLGHDGKFIHYRGMKLAFQNGQVLMVRREALGANPARNVKFLGNLTGGDDEWGSSLAAARERASAAGLLLSLFTQFDQLHLSESGGLDSNHCLHLYNHYRPSGKKMINKWETYNPIALHRTYERLMRQSQSIVTPQQLASLEFEGLFDPLRASELPEIAHACAPVGPRESRALLLVTRRWVSDNACAIGERVVSRYNDGREWFSGEVVAVRGLPLRGVPPSSAPPFLKTPLATAATALDAPVADAAHADLSSVLYDVQYDDGDFEEDVPLERVLSADGETGRWEYIVIGPEEASVTLPNDQQHPWWPNAEQFVEFAVVSAASTKELAVEVAGQREAAPTKYGKVDGTVDLPWPLGDGSMAADSAGGNGGSGGGAIGQGPGRSKTEGEAEAVTAESHAAKVAADLGRPENRAELIYMFHKLATLFLQVVDTDLRYAHLLPHQLDNAVLQGAPLAATEELWRCAPVAEIAEGTRQKCDVCETSILDRHWACTVAGCEWEVCLQCHRAGERRRAARRERYERLQRGETAAPWHAKVGGSSSASRAARGTHAAAAAARGGCTALARPYEHTSWASKRNDYTGDEAQLQARIHQVFPPLINARGEVWNEFEAVLPKEGKYVGQPCAKCNVPQCSMRERVFHHKNLATHGKPRASGLKVNVFSRTHEAAFHAFSKAFVGSERSVEEAEVAMVATPAELPPKPPPPGNKNRQKKIASKKAIETTKARKAAAGAEGAPGADADVREGEEEGDDEEGEEEEGEEEGDEEEGGEEGGEAEEEEEEELTEEQLAERRLKEVDCPACNGKHRAHSCGRKVKAKPLPRKRRKAGFGAAKASRQKHRDSEGRVRATQRLVEEAKWLMGEGEVLWGERGRPKRQKRTPDAPSADADDGGARRSGRSSSRGKAAAPPPPPPAAVADDEDDEVEDLPCFCGTDRHLPTNDIPFEGAWVGCDHCPRWCHGECAGLTKAQSEAIETYECPVCADKRRAREAGGRGANGLANGLANGPLKPLPPPMPNALKPLPPPLPNALLNGLPTPLQNGHAVRGGSMGAGTSSSVGGASSPMQSGGQGPGGQGPGGQGPPVRESDAAPAAAISGPADEDDDDDEEEEELDDDDEGEELDDDEHAAARVGEEGDDDDDDGHASDALSHASDGASAEPVDGLFGDDDDVDDAEASARLAAAVAEVEADDEDDAFHMSRPAHLSGDDDDDDADDDDEDSHDDLLDEDGRAIYDEDDEGLLAFVSAANDDDDDGVVGGVDGGVDEDGMGGEEEDDEVGGEEEGEEGDDVEIGGAEGDEDGWDDRTPTEQMPPPPTGLDAAAVAPQPMEGDDDVAVDDDEEDADGFEAPPDHAAYTAAPSGAWRAMWVGGATPAPSANAEATHMSADGSGASGDDAMETDGEQPGSAEASPAAANGITPHEVAHDDDSDGDGGSVQAPAPALAPAPPPVPAVDLETHLARELAARAVRTALSGVGEEPSTDSPYEPSADTLRRNLLATRLGGTSIPVGEHVAVLRPGEHHGAQGLVLLARSGYYQVRLPNTAPIFFRGKELWPLSDGPPPTAAEMATAEQASLAPRRVSATDHHIIAGVKRERDESPRSNVAGGSGSGGAGPSGSGEGGADGGEQPKWWWQSWIGVEGVRRRKPTQLYDATTGDQTEAFVPQGSLVEPVVPRFDGVSRGAAPRRDRNEAALSGLVAGAEVVVLKRGEYLHRAGIIQSMHNGYFQVRLAGGNGGTLNLRAKECQVRDPNHDHLPPPPLDASLMGDGAHVGGPTASAAPPRLLGGAAPHKPSGVHRPSGSHIISTKRSGSSKRSTDIVVGQHVQVQRHAAHSGSSGLVVAARNGYLIVQLENGRSAYFRAKDVRRIGGGRGGGDVAELAQQSQPERVKDMPGQRRPHVNPRGFCGAARSTARAPTARARAPAAEPSGGGRQRMSWRDNMHDEGAARQVDAPHEHQYERAVKVAQEDVSALVGNVESLLARLGKPPASTRMAHDPEAATYAGSSLRLLPSSDPVAQLMDFQTRWRRGEPVVMGDLQSRFKRRWGPHGFLQRFGAESVQMIDCRDGKSVHWLTLAHFFAGYMQPWTRAICPDTFRKMMLKLKDWPPDQDFQSKMPEYFEDLMQALPFPQYTHRDGVLNLAKYFPRQYVPPDLGPKMYNAYGRHAAWKGMDPQTSKGGHTNLHCDVSDAVNVMVDVGFDDEHEYDEIGEDAKMLKDDELGELRHQHGAIWDIYRWEDTEAILSLLHAVARERDVEITNNPIHDQLFYLDDVLRRRLRDQYGVRGWRFVQRHGDAVFIPAGCPHQVRNLSSCVKVALDFVSPENAHRCVQLTDQFAKLPRGHHLSEDKLQVKTMLLHAMSHISNSLLADGLDQLPIPQHEPSEAQPAAAAAGAAISAAPSGMAPASDAPLGAICSPCEPSDAADMTIEDTAPSVPTADEAVVEVKQEVGSADGAPPTGAEEPKAAEEPEATEASAMDVEVGAASA